LNVLDLDVFGLHVQKPARGAAVEAVPDHKLNRFVNASERKNAAWVENKHRCPVGKLD
jgi:hypothetical protein